MNETRSTTLTEFLLARLEEDEAGAKAASTGPWGTWAGRRSYVEQASAPEYTVLLQAAPRGTDADVAHVARHNPARVLAEVEAKRRIVAMHADRDCEDQRFGPIEWALPEGQTPVTDGMVIASQRVLGCETLAHLASVYADHPDYREEWRA